MSMCIREQVLITPRAMAFFGTWTSRCVHVASVLHAVCKAAYALHAMQLVPCLMQFTLMPISTSNCFAAHEQILVLFAL